MIFGLLLCAATMQLSADIRPETFFASNDVGDVYSSNFVYDLFEQARDDEFVSSDVMQWLEKYESLPPEKKMQFKIESGKQILGKVIYACKSKKNTISSDACEKKFMRKVANMTLKAGEESHQKIEKKYLKSVQRQKDLKDIVKDTCGIESLDNKEAEKN